MSTPSDRSRGSQSFRSGLGLLIVKIALEITSELVSEDGSALLDELARHKWEEAIPINLLEMRLIVLLLRMGLKHQIVLSLEVIEEELLIVGSSLSLEALKVGDLGQEVILLPQFLVECLLVVVELLSNLLEVLLHDLLARLLVLVTNLLSEADDFLVRVRELLVLLIANVSHTLKLDVGSLWVGISHVEAS